MLRKLLTVMLLLGFMVPANIAFALPSTSSNSIDSFSLTDSPPLLGFTQIISGLASPVSITHAGDASGRLFITLQGGKIMIYDGAQVVGTPFLDVSSLISTGGERGLLSVAFHPNYESNGFLYVFYTRSSDGALVIARYHVSPDPNIVDASSAFVLLTIPHAGASNHNGGQLQFGPDGYLYIGTGDGGTGGSSAQSGTSLLGKILRIDVDSGSPYAIPADNPFNSNAAVEDEVWALGLRNPWRFSFDRLTGDLIIADVGQNDWEEVNIQLDSSAGGQNYGWPCNEGMHPYANFVSCTHGVITNPAVEYNHGASDSNGCSITGGYRYRGNTYPGLYGVYLYGDLCTGRVWGASPDGSLWTAVELSDTAYTITTFGEDEAGDLYVVNYSSGAVYKILASSFSDVAPTYWAWNWIEDLYGAGITGGCLTTPLSYCPENSVTRAQMAVFLLKGIHGSAYIPPVVGVDTGFADVAADHWAAAWIKQLAAEGITSGCGAGNYCPENSVTRAQMAIFLLNAKYGSAYEPPAPAGVFTDVPIGYWADQWIEQLAFEGITSGCGSGIYCPDADVTRAQMAVFLMRTFNP